MPLQQTTGNVTTDAYGGGVAAVPNYIEDVFSTYLYTGNTTAQTITNGIDLAGKGGMVWIKSRTSAAGHALWDTARTPYYYLVSNATSAEQSVGSSNALTSYNADGFTVTGGSNAWNGSQNYTSWTFRKQPKFFDVVTYTGDADPARTISHNLGSVPGCIIVKETGGVRDWVVYHTSTGNTKYLTLNSTSPGGTQSFWNNTSPTSTVFSVNGDWNAVNGLDRTYVAYLFAHNAGGFGLTGTDNVISCGSFTTDSGGNATVSLGYEPAWVMFKCSSNAGQNWEMIDTMRGWSMSTDVSLQANSSAAEAPGGFGNPTATGFVMGGQGNTQTYIYIAIRRGPMKVPTSGTSVFSPVVRTGTSAAATVSTTNLTDMSLIINKDRSSNSYNIVSDRLRGPANTTSGSYNLTTNDAVAEYLPASATVTGFNNNNVTLGTNDGVNYSGSTYINYFFSRAPSFFDEVCYTGTGSAGFTQTHNLRVVPELMIFKPRNNASGWRVYSSAVGATKYLVLNNDTAADTYTFWNDTAPTSTIFTLGATFLNDPGITCVAYLFATCAGVSKVGSYTGTGATQTINCGFSAGARWVLIKRTDSTGDWYTYDSARGISSGNDPYLFLNSTAAEVTNTNYVDTDSTGFKVTAAAPAGLNANGGTYIFLAIA